jgi:hypothetical protein
LHVDAMKASPDAAQAGGDAATAPATAAAAVAHMESRDDDEQVAALMRGDWCAFGGEADAAPVLARFAWRAPHETSLLFTHRDGTTAFIHTPRTLAEAFGARRATVAVEGVPLFERAMARLMEQRSPATASAED